MHSEHFELVKYHYITKRWNLAKVRKAVGKWITAEEFTEITKKPY